MTHEEIAWTVRKFVECRFKAKNEYLPQISYAFSIDADSLRDLAEEYDQFERARMYGYAWKENREPKVVIEYDKRKNAKVARVKFAVYAQQEPRQ